MVKDLEATDVANEFATSLAPIFPCIEECEYHRNREDVIELVDRHDGGWIAVTQLCVAVCIQSRVRVEYMFVEQVTSNSVIRRYWFPNSSELLNAD